MTEGNDALEKNLERLIRESAPPPPDVVRARREFLARVEGTPHVRLGRMIAMAASLLAAAVILYSAFAPKAPVVPVKEARVQEPSAAPPVPEPPPPAPETPPVKPARPDSAPGPASQPVIARDGGATLSCRIPSPRAPDPKLMFEGTLALPDRTELTASVKRMRETYVKGRFIAHSDSVELTALTEVSGKRFPIQARWEGPGRYVASVALSGGQKTDVAPALRKVAWKSSTFEFDGWNDELVGQLVPALKDLEGLVAECIEMVAKLERLASKESNWVQERRKINERAEEVILTKQAEEALNETERLLERIQSSGSRALLAVSHGEILSTLHLLWGNAKNFHYENGKMAGARTYHGQIKTLRGDALDFETVRKYLDEVSAIAGRETALWIVKDLKRTRAESRPALTDALKKCGHHPGIVSVSDRLGAARIEELDALEEEIRAGK